MLHLLWNCILSLALLLTLQLIVITCQEFHDRMDILQPYLYHHGPFHRTNRDTQHICQSVKYGNVTYSLHKAFENSSSNLFPVQSYLLTKETGPYWQKKYAHVLHQVVTNPLTTVSIKEPGYLGSCLDESGRRATVRETAHQNQCVFASNAGYFNTHNGHCLGNVVSDGKFVHNSGGIQNVHFGITKDGKLFTGYLSELDFLAYDFKQLVGGVIWLVRDGVDYVDDSMKVECPDTEETGTLERFVNVISARTAIGHDKQGKVHIVQVNGMTDRAGVNLHEFSQLLIELGIINAINLDGGGSVTSVINGTVANFPSDKCPDKVTNCERAVSTVVCVHYPQCATPDCSNHGECVKGKCECRDPWVGDRCEVMDVHRCGPRGSWINGGCECDAGWHGLNCSLSCPVGWYGRNCTNQCLCGDHGDCHVQTGECTCHAGYTGKYCQQKCPYGFYGLDCVDVCFCQDSCFCDHVTGSCNATHVHSDYLKAGDCLAKHAITKNNLVPDRHEQYSLCISSVACLCVIATASLILNAVFTYLLVKLRRVAASNDQKDSLELASTSFMSKPTEDRTKRFKRRKKRQRDQLKNSSNYNALNGNMGMLGRGCGSAGDESMTYFSNFKRNERDSHRHSAVDNDDNATVTGSGEDENDLFLARKKERV